MKTILVDALNTFVIEEKGVFEEMHSLLETYPNKKIVLTNANNEQIVEFGMMELPYELFTLKHAPNKDNPEYFKKMLKHFDLDKDEVIYFEHNLEAVKSAESVGITSFHYGAEKKDLDKLKEFLDKNI